MCLLGGYILIGAVYRYYFLGIHSVEVKLVFQESSIYMPHSFYVKLYGV